MSLSGCAPHVLPTIVYPYNSAMCFCYVAVLLIVIPMSWTVLLVKEN